MSTPLLVTLNVLNVLTGGTAMGRHSAPAQKRAERSSDNYTKVAAPKCPHGHFARWARSNCKPCKEGK